MFNRLRDWITAKQMIKMLVFMSSMIWRNIITEVITQNPMKEMKYLRIPNLYLLRPLNKISLDTCFLQYLITINTSTPNLTSIASILNTRRIIDPVWASIRFHHEEPLMIWPPSIARLTKSWYRFSVKYLNGNANRMKFFRFGSFQSIKLSNF